MLSAPMMMPLLGQLTRLWWRVVSAVIVSPQLTWLASAWPPLKATTPATAMPRITASETNVARAAWNRSLVGIVVLPLGGDRILAPSATVQPVLIGPGWTELIGWLPR